MIWLNLWAGGRTTIHRYLDIAFQLSAVDSFSTTTKLFYRYTRDFSIDKNTHLIANFAQGAKFDLAKSYSHIHVVKPSWLLACSKEGSRVEETAHLLDSQAKENDEIQVDSSLLALEVELLLNGGKMLCSVFKNCRFYMLGFDEHNDFKKALGKLIRRGMVSELNDSSHLEIIGRSPCHTGDNLLGLE